MPNASDGLFVATSRQSLPSLKKRPSVRTPDKYSKSSVARNFRNPSIGPTNYSDVLGVHGVMLALSEVEGAVQFVVTLEFQHAGRIVCV